MLEFHSDIPEELGFIRNSKWRTEIKSLTFRRSVMSYSAGPSCPKKEFQESSVSFITSTYMRSALFLEFTQWEWYSKKNSSWNVWPLKIGLIAWTKISVQIYTILRCVKSPLQKTYVIYIAVKAWNHDSIYFSLFLYESEKLIFRVNRWTQTASCWVEGPQENMW
jgi:hypothetical protein